MGAAYPELVRAEALISETLRLEETRFRSLLERGLHLLAEETARLGSGQTLPGEVAFRLYDTYGFPLDLTQDALRAEGRPVDVDGFNAAMAEQRKRARAAWSGSGEAATEGVWFDLKEKVGASEFLGYTTETAEGEILAIVKDGQPVDAAAVGSEVAVLLNQTPFYAESGGQVGDTGIIRARPAGLRCATRRRSCTGSMSMSARWSRARRGSASPCRPRSRMSAGRGSARTTPRRTCCTRRCAAASARMSRRRAR
jgi:alanyl-tRNA synthetase